MSKGYLVLATGNFTKMAELLAASIKKSQTGINNISLITDDPLYQNELFEHIILVSGDTIYNRTQVYNLSPYEETVSLDADMIFLEDVSHWWNHFEKYSLLITNKVKTYRNEWVSKSPYRKTFVSNDLPNCYCAFSYFKKSSEAEEFFTMLGHIVSDWDTWTMKFAPENRQKIPSIDVAMGIALKILGIDAFSQLDFPTFTHMKSGCQGWPRYSEDWRTHIGMYIEGNKLRLGPYVQTGILHYVDKGIVDELLCLL